MKDGLVSVQECNIKLVNPVLIVVNHGGRRHQRTASASISG